MQLETLAPDLPLAETTVAPTSEPQQVTISGYCIVKSRITFFVVIEKCLILIIPHLYIHSLI